MASRRMQLSEKDIWKFTDELEQSDINEDSDCEEVKFDYFSFYIYKSLWNSKNIVA